MSVEIKSYLDRHGLRVEMNSNLMLDAFTLLSSTNNGHMVLIMDTEIVKNEPGRPVHHVSYEDFISKSDDKLKKQVQYEQDEGRYFRLVERKD